MLQNLDRYHPPIRCYPAADLIPKISILEIGPGRGDFLFTLARAHPEKIVGAIEVRRKRFEKLIPRLRRERIANVVLLLGDARVVLPRLFEKGQLTKVYSLFPDPWPKKRHHKHRLFQGFFVEELFRVLRGDGTVVVAHDDSGYLGEIQGLFVHHPSFQSKPIAGDNGDPQLDIFQTFYAQKWLEAGRTVAASCFQKVSERAAGPLRARGPTGPEAVASESLSSEGDKPPHAERAPGATRRD